MSVAPETNASVMTATEGVPACSAATASCRLHDEQLPQSPTPANMTAHFAVCSMRADSAGAE
jgi:hypothetical protein